MLQAAGLLGDVWMQDLCRFAYAKRDLSAAKSHAGINPPSPPLDRQSRIQYILKFRAYKGFGRRIARKGER
ncbi:hypothetical protein KFK09_022266 [Dendrobium nobile]|uniref:Uncharacterized protein n=1 Tax=Dendrobium nobile TaxID=94219 RepID=A0A8T3AI50_DENNO|nr:hypothetical protein KFK09_022266 [Dendrobium nobile]